MPEDPHPPHSAPEAITVAEAHQIMRDHIGCAGSRCAMRHIALRVLVEAGAYTLAS
ncbi:MAG: hypothetical protein QOI01_1626 [Mycobacterium sp.]|jgi:hypothetical protein|nr:hypothetical protein [Mycobacterium sp.]